LDTRKCESAIGNHPPGGFHIRLVQRPGVTQMTLPLAALFGQYVPPVGGIPFESPGGVALKTLGRPAIGFDLRHFFFLTPPFLIE